MGKTITEKILGRNVGHEVSPGDFIEVRSRLPITSGPGLGRGGPLALKAGMTKIFDPKMLRMVDGHTGSTASHNAGNSRAEGRRVALEMGVPQENIYNLGRQGVEHVVAGDHAWALPGELFLQGTNGHTTTLGALGAFCFTLSFGTGAYLATGWTWVRVPKTVKIVLKGKLPPGTMGRDISEYTLAQMGPSSCTGMVMEWTGPVVEELSMDARFTLCCNAISYGAWTAIVPPDQKTLDYVRERNPEPFEPLYSDPDAEYAKVYEFDVSNLEPHVVPPPDRWTGAPVANFVGTKVNWGFIGSCDNGRMEDMRIAARILKGRKIHPDVILNITPATVGIYKQCLQEGIIDIFTDAEAVIPSPNCGMCWGANTPLAAGDVCVSSGTCNYPGRMGSKDSEIYLGSPATVAAAAVEGQIVDPRKYLG